MLSELYQLTRKAEDERIFKKISRSVTSTGALGLMRVRGRNPFWRRGDWIESDVSNTRSKIDDSRSYNGTEKTNDSRYFRRNGWNHRGYERSHNHCRTISNCRSELRVNVHLNRLLFSVHNAGPQTSRRLGKSAFPIHSNGFPVPRSKFPNVRSIFLSVSVVVIDPRSQRNDDFHSPAAPASLFAFIRKTLSPVQNRELLF